VDYVQSYLSLFIKEDTAKHNIANKVVLITDNALGHTACVVEYGDNIQVVFLPSNTTSLLQPTDQRVIATFKTYYAQLLMQYLVQGADVNQEASLRDMWKGTDIKALEFTDKAWQRVSPQTMNGVWQKLTPQFVVDFIGYEEVDEKDVEELLEFHVEEMAPTELVELDVQRQPG
jgi:hypothetical protein